MNALDVTTDDLEHMRQVQGSQRFQLFINSSTQLHALEDQLQQAQDESTGRVDPQKVEEFKQILATAQQLHEQAATRQAERQRRREQQNAQSQERRRRLETEAARVKSWTARRAATSGELARLFSDLQAMSIDNNLALRCPELVVVGMQSDGKSSLVEALLGFTFNIVSSNIGTRRPLIISMINSRAHPEPCCRFRLEESAGGEEYESAPTLPANLSAEIVRRTNAVAGSDASRVSARPIFLRVEYANCANLTIYDTPGFRLRGDERLAQEIHDMVMDLIRPPERLIVCLEQSTVEWANTTSRHLVQKVDPDFRRTVLLHTKFDNRCKELRSVEEATKYLQGEGLPAKVANFFISLPAARDLPPKQFQEAIQDSYLQDYAHLLRIGLDDKELLAKIGFCKMEDFLERQMTKRYQTAFLPTLETLERGVIDQTARLQALDRSISEKDPSLVRARASVYVSKVTGVIERLLSGSAVGDPEQFGQTLSQERAQVGGASWTALDLDYPIENTQRKLYGGPQFHRLVNEFTWIAHTVELPATSIDEVAAALGSHPSHNLPSYETAASDLVNLKAKQVLHPILHTTAQRARYIMGRLFDVAVAVVHRDDADMSAVGACAAFRDSLHQTYAEVLDGLFVKCSDKMLEDVNSFTEVLDCWGVCAPASPNAAVATLLDQSVALAEANKADEAAACTKQALAALSRPLPPQQQQATSNAARDQTRARVVQLMSRQDVWPSSFPSSAGRQVDDVTYRAFIALCRKLFDSIRFKFVQVVRNKLSSLILKPMFERMRETVVEHFRVAIPSEAFAAVFEAGTRVLEQDRAALHRKLAYTTALRDQFRLAASKFGSHASSQEQPQREH